MWTIGKTFLKKRKKGLVRKKKNEEIEKVVWSSSLVVITVIVPVLVGVQKPTRKCRRRSPENP